MKVIVGSRDLWPTPNLASAVLDIISSTDEEIAVRYKDFNQTSSAIEEMAIKIADRLGRDRAAFLPDGRHGSAAGFKRDIRMVTKATEVHAFFAPGQLMHGGTGHVVMTALNMGRPVRAYELDDGGKVVESASDEGELLQLWEHEGWS